MNLQVVTITKPEEVNVVLSQAHFIKTVDDLHEALALAVGRGRFGMAFCEASGARLVRKSGNDVELVELAVANARALGAGHSFVIFLRDLYPVSVLNAIKAVPEVCRVFCATANRVDVIVASNDLGRGILGVIDGESPVGVEGGADQGERRELLSSWFFRSGRRSPEASLPVRARCRSPSLRSGPGRTKGSSFGL